MEEIWKDIPDYEGRYQVSDFGNVRSVEREFLSSNGDHRKRKQLPIKGTVNKRGYVRIVLQKNGERKHFHAHALVLRAFIGYSDLTIDHINGVKNDNRLKNLEYVTCRENVGRFHLNNGKKTSKYIGVSFDKIKNNWTAHITIQNKNRYLGMFDTEEGARDAYLKALKFHEENPNYEYKIRVKKYKYIGVFFHSDRKKCWSARCTIAGNGKTIGYFKCDTAAFFARQKYLSQVNNIGL